MVISETMYIFPTCFALSPDPKGTGHSVCNSFSSSYVARIRVLFPVCLPRSSHVAGIRAVSPVCLSPVAAASFSVSGAGVGGLLFHFLISR